MRCELTTRLGIALIFLSSTVLIVTSNHFLGFVGVLAGGLSLVNHNLQRSPDLIAMLACVTAIGAAVQLLNVLPFGMFVLISEPARMCSYSKTFVSRVEDYSKPYLGATVAPGQEELGYPLNMTETAQGHQLPAPSSSYLKLANYANTMSDIVCGENAKSALFGIGLAILAFGLCVLLPLMVISLRLLRAARQNGGCAMCDGVPMQAVVVQVPAYHAAPSAPHYHAGPSRPQAKPAGPSCNAPIAQAVPVAQAAAVRAAPRATEMH